MALYATFLEKFYSKDQNLRSYNFQRKLFRFYSMKNYSMNQWTHELEIAGPKSARNNKLHAYKIFGANNLEIEKYLTISLSFKDRQCLTKFTCSDHNLEIEVRQRKGVYAPNNLISSVLYDIDLNKTFKNKNNRTLSRVFLKHDVSS